MVGLMDFVAKLSQFMAVVGVLILMSFLIGKAFMWLHKSKLKIAFRKPHGIIFGKIGKILFYSPENEEQHVTVFGGSGLGKTSSILIPTLNTWRGTSMVVDIAGDINKNVFMPNKLIFEPESNNCIPYDIFAPVHKKKTTHEKNEALEQIAYLIMPDRQFTSDSGKFFNDGGRNFLTASLIAFYWQGMSFITICEKIVGTDWRNLCQEIDETGNQLAMQYISAFYGASDQNNAGCKGSCDDAIKLFATNEAVKHALRTPMPGQQSFEPASMEGHNVFFVIEDSKLKLYAPLLHIVTAQCLDYFSTRPNYTGNHILLCLDEFASLGKLEILDALRKYRKKRVRIMVLTQSLADIHLLYGRTETEAMLENCLFKVILGATSKESQVYFSDLIGRKQPFLRSVARHADDAGFAVEPARLANLGRQLILLHPNGYVKLWKNYYFR